MCREDIDGIRIQPLRHAAQQSRIARFEALQGIVAQHLADLRRLAVGEKIDAHLFPAEAEFSGPEHILRTGGDKNPALAQQGRADRQPVGAVVVPGDGGERDPERAELPDHLVEQADGGRRGDRPVVDVVPARD